MEVTSTSAEATEKLGASIGDHLVKAGRGSHAATILLSGELGSGKTTFVKGLAKALGIPYRILSPTFVLVKRYPLSKLPFAWFYHVDLYRMTGGLDAGSLGLAEILADPAAIVAIEWCERLGKLNVHEAAAITFKQDEKDVNRRLISIEGIEI